MLLHMSTVDNAIPASGRGQMPSRCWRASPPLQEHGGTQGLGLVVSLPLLCSLDGNARRNLMPARKALAGSTGPPADDQEHHVQSWSVKHHGHESAHRMQHNLIRVASSPIRQCPRAPRSLPHRPEASSGSTTTPALDLTLQMQSPKLRSGRSPHGRVGSIERRPPAMRPDCTSCVVLSATEYSPA
jgi:hypothetical protein